MVSKETLLGYLPAFKRNYRMVYWQQDTALISKEILKAHQEYETEYDVIYPFFDTGDVYSTCRALWDFCKYSLCYNAETDDDQSVKSPTAILQSNEKIDCKHYSLFIAGVLDAIKANEGGNWTWFYRFCSDDKKALIKHVYVVVVLDDGNEIWVDPVLSSFDERVTWEHCEDIGFKDIAPAIVSGLKKNNNFETWHYTQLAG